MNALLDKLEAEIQKRKMSPEEISDALSSFSPATDRRIISGYASVAVVDREGHRITIPALQEAVGRFMQQAYFRPVTVFHSDIQLGRILPKWTDPKTGKTHKTEVDQTGWKVVCEIRSDVEIADKVWDEIQKGNIRSFSIAGTSKEKSSEQQGGRTFTDIDKLDAFEVALCEQGVNQLSKFEVLWDPNKVSI